MNKNKLSESEFDHKIINFHNNNNLLYPWFSMCIEYTDNPKTIAFFKNLSNGKCDIPGISVTKQHIISIIPNKEFVYNIDPLSDPLVLYENIYNLLLNDENDEYYCDSSDLQSLENTTTTTNINNIPTTVVYNTWNNIRKKSIKDSIIMNFVNSISKKYNFSKRTSEHMLNVINLSLMLKFIVTSDIDYDDGAIKKIRKFIYEDNYFEYEIYDSTGKMGKLNVILCKNDHLSFENQVPVESVVLLLNEDNSDNNNSKEPLNCCRISLIDSWCKMIEILSLTVKNK